MLPTTMDGLSAHITGDFGKRERPKGQDGTEGTEYHNGIDFNYAVGQNGINLTHPPVYSPIAGKVESINKGLGEVTIRDADGNLHKILHLHEWNMAVGDEIRVRDQIGTMGGRANGKPNVWPQHIDYRVQNPKG